MLLLNLLRKRNSWAIAAVIIALVLIIKFWATILVFLLYTVLALALGLGACYAGEQVKSKYALAAGIAVFAIVMWGGVRDMVFDVKIHRLELEFLHAAYYDPHEIRGQELDYHGSLTEITKKRDRLLRSYWHVMGYRDKWWTDTDYGPRIDASYHFSLDGWMMPPRDYQ